MKESINITTNYYSHYYNL